MTDNLPFEWLTKKGATDFYTVPHPWIDLYFFYVETNPEKNKVSVSLYKYIGSVKQKIKDDTEFKLKRLDRMPTYEEMQTVRSVFFKDEERVTIDVALLPVKTLSMRADVAKKKLNTWDRIVIWAYSLKGKLSWK
ncbi:MAG: hypothetical protein ACK52I_02725 [Pseudomonadota bacterium]|jgi:hypothetical protein